MLFDNKFEKIKYELDDWWKTISSLEAQLKSSESRVNSGSQMIETLRKLSDQQSQNMQQQNDSIAQLEEKIHELLLARMAEESSRAEILNTSFPVSKELELRIKEIEEKNYNVESYFASNDDRTKRLETQIQRLCQTETKAERKWESLEVEFREGFERIYEQINSAKQDVKSEIFGELPNFDHIMNIDQHMKTLRISYKNTENRIVTLEKELEAGLVNNELKEDLSQLRDLSSSIGKINEAFKEDVYRLEKQIKENSVKLLDSQNELMDVRSTFDSKISKQAHDSSENFRKIQELDDLFNEMYWVIKKYNMNEK